jgi:hypothetical protein
MRCARQTRVKPAHTRDGRLMVLYFWLAMAASCSTLSRGGWATDVASTTTDDADEASETYPTSVKRADDDL